MTGYCYKSVFLLPESEQSTEDTGGASEVVAIQAQFADTERKRTGRDRNHHR